MNNIPTELLRTFVAVVDMRSFTRAAQSLGITQPAVSAQVKRLQTLLGGELMDKSAPGVMLTPMGESVLGSARELLAINDRILTLAAAPADAATIRVGLPGDFIGDVLWRTVAHSRETRPDVAFHLKSCPSEILARELGQGDLDVAVIVSGTGPYADARYHWTESMVWVHAALTRLDPDVPVPLVSHGDKCLMHRHVGEALERAGRAYKLSFTETSITSLATAVGAGLGGMALPRCAPLPADLSVWDAAPLPPLPAMVCNVCVRAGAHEAADRFAQDLAAAYAARRARPRPTPPPALTASKVGTSPAVAGDARRGHFAHQPDAAPIRRGAVQESLDVIWMPWLPRPLDAILRTRRRWARLMRPRMKSSPRPSSPKRRGRLPPRRGSMRVRPG